MKISLWMIANQLEGKDIELNINEPYTARYKSIHFKEVLACDDCLYLKQDGEDVLLIGGGEDNHIRLINTDKEDAAELIQNVFDTYSDWDEMIHENMGMQNYQTIIDKSWRLFRLPLLLLDSNSKLLAMSSQIGADDLNPEWKHLSEYGYQSVSVYKSFEKRIKDQEADLSKKPVLYKKPSSHDEANCLMALVRHNNIVYGRIAVLDYFREFTQGDYQILEHLCDVLEWYLVSIKKDNQKLYINNNILKLIQGQPVEKEAIQHFMRYMKWTDEDKFRICVIAFNNMTVAQNVVLLIKEYLNINFPTTPSFSLENQLVLLFNERENLFNDIIPKIEQSYIYELNTVFGYSLQCDSIDNIGEYVKQSLFAIKQGCIKNPDSKFSSFYDYALDYILCSNEIKEKYHACQPDVMELWEKQPNCENESIMTLREYLANDRSLLQASAELFMHKNTLNYRINKIVGNMQYNLDDKYTREYILTSIRMLDLFSYERKQVEFLISG